MVKKGRIMTFLANTFKPNDTYMFLAGGCLLSAIALLGSCLRYFYSRHKLVKYLKEHNPHLFQDINRSSFALSRFMITTEDTGDNVVDVLKLKTQIARKYIRIFLVGMLVIFVILVLSVLIRN